MLLQIKKYLLGILDGFSEEEKEIFNNEKEISYEFFSTVISKVAITSGKTLLDATISKKEYYERMKKDFPEEYRQKGYEEPSEEDILNLQEISRQWKDLKVRMSPYKELTNLNQAILTMAMKPTISAIKDGSHIKSINTSLVELSRAVDVFKEEIISDEELDNFEKGIVEIVEDLPEKYKNLLEKTVSEVIDAYNLEETIKQEYLKNKSSKEKWGKSYWGDELLESSFEIDENGELKVLDEERAKKLIIEGGDNKLYCQELFSKEYGMMIEVNKFFNEYREKYQKNDKSRKKERAEKENELNELQNEDQKCDEALALVEELDKEQEGQTQGEE